MLRKNILLLCLIGWITIDSGCCSLQEIQQDLLNHLFDEEKYDKRVRPSGKGGPGPTVVEINVFIRDIEFINELKSEYGLQLTFRQKWHDNRLAYNASEDLKFISLTEADDAWMPDTFFSNERSSKFFNLMRPNQYFRIYPSGDVVYSTRMWMKVSCIMIYKLFPFDKQTCSLRIASYGATNDDISYQWKMPDPVQMTSEGHVQFHFQLVATDYCDALTNTGVYSCLRADFLFARVYEPYIFHVYIPFSMMVVIAWLGTLLDKNSEVIRGLTSMITLYVMATQVGELNRNIPSTSYAKGIDIWTGACLAFVFATFAEFVIVNRLGKSEERGEKYKKEETVVKDKKSDTNDQTQTPVPKKSRYEAKGSDKLDSFFRKFFPFAFILFVAIYVSVYIFVIF